MIIGQIIRALIGDESVTEAAERLGVGRAALSAVLNGRADLSLSLASKIQQVYGDKAMMEGFPGESLGERLLIEQVRIKYLEYRLEQGFHL